VTTSDSVPAAAPAPNGGRRTTSVVVGTAVVLWDRLAPTRERPGWREVAVGAVFEAEDVAAALTGGVRRAAAIARLRTVPGRAVTRLRTTPGPSAAVDVARGRLSRLAERGVAEEDRGRQRAVNVIDSLMTAVATAPMVERVVDVQVERLIRPLVASILDDVLDQLERDPQRVQALIRGQRESMVNELVGRIRQTTAAGDAAVDRGTARVLHRTAPAVPRPPTATPSPT
jgi:hypothetical protein